MILEHRRAVSCIYDCEVSSGVQFASPFCSGPPITPLWSKVHLLWEERPPPARSPCPPRKTPGTTFL